MIPQLQAEKRGQTPRQLAMLQRASAARYKGKHSRRMGPRGNGRLCCYDDGTGCWLKVPLGLTARHRMVRDAEGLTKITCPSCVTWSSGCAGEIKVPNRTV